MAVIKEKLLQDSRLLSETGVESNVSDKSVGKDGFPTALPFSHCR